MAGELSRWELARAAYDRFADLRSGRAGPVFKREREAFIAAYLGTDLDPNGYAIDPDGTERMKSIGDGAPVCRSCGDELKPECAWIADGCPCNAPRGTNHGIVARRTCTCALCDPEQTGSTRAPERLPMPIGWRRELERKGGAR